MTIIHHSEQHHHPDDKAAGLQHSGRGGAGNVERKSAEARLADSEAPFPPVLKGPYSTGRGGAANVMHNDAGPHVARIAQDLEGPDRQTADTRMMSPMQYAGRGGAGNIIKSREASRSRSRTRGPNESKDGEGSEHSQALSERIKHVFEKVK